MQWNLSERDVYEVEYIVSNEVDMAATATDINEFGFQEATIDGESFFIDQIYAAMTKHTLSSFRLEMDKSSTTLKKLEEDFVQHSASDDVLDS